VFIEEATIGLSLVCRESRHPQKKAQATESRPRNGPASSLFLQPAILLAIVQTYSELQAAPKDSTFRTTQQDGTSEADYGAAIVHVDGGASPDFWKAGHKHDVAGDHHNEAGTRGKRGVVDVERPASRCAKALRIIG